jgi:hypothetical protein
MRALSVFNHRLVNNGVPTHRGEVQNGATRSLVWKTLVVRSIRVHRPVVTEYELRPMSGTFRKRRR